MLDDGINAFSMEYQPEEFYKNQPADIQECLMHTEWKIMWNCSVKTMLQVHGIRCTHIQIRFLRHPNVEK